MLSDSKPSSIIEDNFFEWEERQESVPFWQHVIAGT